MKGLPILCAISLAAAVHAASPTDDLLELLRSDLKAEIKEGRNKGDNAAYQYQELLMRLQRGEGDEGEGTLLMAVEGVGTMSASEKISTLCTEIATQLRKQIADRDAAAVAEMGKVFPESLRKALDGKTAKDVDEPLVAVGKLVRERNNGRVVDAKLRALINDGQQLWEFLRQWQDYLAETDAGDERGAQQKLQNLIGYGRDFSSFIPRSELLARMNALQKKAAPREEQQPTRERSQPEVAAIFKKIMDNCESLEQLPETIAALNAENVNNRAMVHPPFNNTLNTLRQIQRSVEEFQRGQSVRVSIVTYGDETDPKVSLLRGQLLLRTLPRVLGLPEDQTPAPAGNAADFLQRKLAEAKTKGDWAFAARVLETAQTMNVQLVSSTNDSTSLRSFLAGINQEKARQYPLAVASFQAALKAGSQFIPPETIGDHLDAIKTADAKAFEQGMQLTLNPPPEPRSGDYPGPYGPGIPPAVLNRMYPRGMTPPEKPAEALTVPAKPAPEAKAAPAAAAAAEKGK